MRKYLISLSFGRSMRLQQPTCQKLTSSLQDQVDRRTCQGGKTTLKGELAQRQCRLRSDSKPPGRRGSVRNHALQIETSPTFQEVQEGAKEALTQAEDLVSQLEQAAADLVDCSKHAEQAQRKAEEYERSACALVDKVEAILKIVRKEIVELQGQHEELSSEDLHSLAKYLIQQWKQDAGVSSHEEGMREQTGISGLQDAQLAAQTIKVSKDGRKCIVTAIAIGQRFPSGGLEDTAIHWGCSDSKSKKWQPPPHGWHTIPPVSRPAGRAWQTRFAPYLPVTEDKPNSSRPAYAVLVELPADGVLADGGGLNFVLKRPRGSQPEWLQGTGNKDFEIAFSKKPTYVMPVSIADPALL